jgi:parallel beta-helix repeat protein
MPLRLTLSRRIALSAPILLAACETSGTLTTADADPPTMSSRQHRTSSPGAQSGVAVFPGQSIQAAVDANPAGTMFLIKAGIHRRQMVLPKAGDVFVGEAGTVMDGEKVVQYAFRSSAGKPDNVTIRGIRITRYAPPLQLAMIEGAFYGNAGELTSGWVVENCEIDNSTNVGIKPGSNWIVRNNNIHHNGRLGLGSGGSNTLIESNEIAWNWLPGITDPVVEAGGSKFSRTTSLVLRNNYVHDNRGPGLWLDIDNDGFLIEGNRIEDNGTGIEIEISYAGIIRNNTIKRSGRANWGFGSAIGIEASGGRGIEVVGNVIEIGPRALDGGVGNGVILMQQNRGTGTLGPRLTQNVSVHDNTVTYSGTGPSIIAGAVQDMRSMAIFSSRNNRFEHNSYTLTGAKGNPFSWNNGYLTDAQWRSLGNDDTGTFRR